MKHKIIILLLSLAICLIPVPSNGQFSRQVPEHEPVKQIGSLQAPSKPVKPKVPAPKPKPQPKPPKKAVVKPKPVARSYGTCEDWKVQAGIPNTHATRTLINNESGCKWWAVNPKSGACGIPQAYPCSKLPCPLTKAGAVCQLRWMKKYVADTYTTWDNALAKWYSRCPTKEGCWY